MSDSDQKEQKMPQKTFEVFDDGFTIKFSNNYTLSTRFGCYHYCENRTMSRPVYYTDHPPAHLTPRSSDDAEIAIINPEGEMVTFDSTDDQVKGNTKIDEWVKIFEWCKTR